MDAEQLQAAYASGWPVPNRGNDAENHLAGLAEVARQQAEHDAQIAEQQAESKYGPQSSDIACHLVATAIRAQFEKEGN